MGLRGIPKVPLHYTNVPNYMLPYRKEFCVIWNTHLLGGGGQLKGVEKVVAVNVAVSP